MDLSTIPQKLEKDNCLLMVIDIQEKLCPTMDQKWLKSVIQRVGLLALYARLEGIPVLLTEQYPQGLGETHPDVKKHLDGASPHHFIKTCFGCADDPRILKAVQDSGMQQIILVGMETHICVTLTARGLRRAGFAVHVCRDAVLARTMEHHENGLQLMRDVGVHITNSETAIFEMMHMSGGTTFKQISNYLKSL